MRALFLPFIAFVSACDVFAIRCGEDDDCPRDVPFCVDDICVDEAEAERRGRNVSEGEGEGESEGCTVDADCPGGLCYDVAGDNGFPDVAGQCVPRAADEDCLSLFASAGATGRDEDGGPVVFDVVVKNDTGTCRDLEVRFFDREGDVSITSPFILVHEDGTGESPSALVSGDGTSGTLPFTICPPAGQTVGIQLLDNFEHKSNIVCHHPP